MSDLFRRAGHYVGRVLKGEKPAEPVSDVGEFVDRRSVGHHAAAIYAVSGRRSHPASPSATHAAPKAAHGGQ